jgi:hypothetical protein
LSQEASLALQANWTNETGTKIDSVFEREKLIIAPEWHPIVLKPSTLRIVSQLSSRVFLGEELCRNEDWLRVTMDYTEHAMKAGQNLRMWPKHLRPFVHWVLPSCRIIRAELAECRALVNPVLEKRRQEKAAQLRQGPKPNEYLDAMEWMEQAAKGRPYDPAISQVMMALAANFSGSDTLAQVIFDLCEQPQLVEDLREEIIKVMKENQWNKSTIYKLRLMDSVLKESQRLKPAAVGE